MRLERRAMSAVRFARQGLLSGAMLLSACATTSATTPDPRPANPVLSEEGTRLKLQAVLDQAAAFEKSPGMVMAVQIGDTEPLFLTTGFQDEDKTRQMTTGMTFRVGSITKNFVGTAILQQVDEGKVRLDDTLQKWLPNVFSNIDGHGITIEQMLRHTSGIESYTNAYIWSRLVYSEPTHLWNAPFEFIKLTENLRANSIRCGVVVKPGSEFAYSNTNFILLGMIAAKADGHPETDWEKVVEQRFFKRLELKDTRIPGKRQDNLDSTNQGYVNFYNFFFDPSTGTSSCSSVKPPCQNEDINFTQQNMSNAWSAGAIMSTAGDLLRWINAEVKGPLLSEETRRKQRTFINTCKAGPQQAPTAAAAPAASADNATPAHPRLRKALSLIAVPQKTPDNDACEPVPTNCEDSVQVGLAMFRQKKYGFIGHRGEIFGFDGTIQWLPEKDLTVVVLSNRTALSGNNVGPVPETVAHVLYPDLKPQDGSAPTSVPTAATP